MTRLIVFIALFYLVSTAMANLPCQLSFGNHAVTVINHIYKRMYNDRQFKELVEKLFHPDAILLTNEKIYRGHAEIVEAIKINGGNIPIKQIHPVIKGHIYNYCFFINRMTYENPSSTFHYYAKLTVRDKKLASLYVFPVQ